MSFSGCFNETTKFTLLVEKVDFETAKIICAQVPGRSLAGVLNSEENGFIASLLLDSGLSLETTELEGVWLGFKGLENSISIPSGNPVRFSLIDETLCCTTFHIPGKVFPWSSTAPEDSGFTQNCIK